MVVIDVFFYVATSKLGGRSFCQCAFFSRHCCLFLSPPATCCSGRQSTAQTRGRKKQEQEKRQDVKRKARHWEKPRKRQTEREKETLRQWDDWRQRNSDSECKMKRKEGISNTHPNRMKHMRANVWRSHAGSHPSTTGRLTVTRVSSN